MGRFLKENKKTKKERIIYYSKSKKNTKSFTKLIQNAYKTDQAAIIYHLKSSSDFMLLITK